MVVSFYTNSWIYKECAMLLSKDLKKHGVEHYFSELPSSGGWLENTALKAGFIQESLARFGEVWWVDADSRILGSPDLFKAPMRSDVVLAPHTRLPRSWHVGCMGFRRCDEVERLVSSWVSHASAPETTDELALERAWLEVLPRVSYTRLPMAYHAIPDSGSYTPGTVVAMGLSRDRSKLERLQKERSRK